jgi:cyclic pyranopterin phosphate synthase
MTPPDPLIDSHGRILRDLGSLTDRCNFRCLYCLPETEAAQNFYRGHWAHLPDSAPIVQQWVPKSKILSFEEIERAVRVAAGLGIQKIRLTGGEPSCATTSNSSSHASRRFPASKTSR